jgi:hypothetical protein
MNTLQSHHTAASAQDNLSSYEREPVSPWAFIGVGLAIGLLFLSMF